MGKKRTQAKIWSSCCNLLNWQDRCWRCSSYTALLAFKCRELQSLSLPGTSQGTSLVRKKQYLSNVCGLQAASIPFICFSVLSPELWLTPAEAWWVFYANGTQNVVFCTDQETSDRNGNYQYRNEQMNMMMDLFLAENIRLSCQQCNSLGKKKTNNKPKKPQNLSKGSRRVKVCASYSVTSPDRTYHIRI